MANNKILGYSIGGIIALVASIATLHQSIEYVNREIIYPSFEAHVDTTIFRYLEKHPTSAQGMAEILNNAFNVKSAAFENIVRRQDLRDWNHMLDTTSHDYTLKYQDGVFYTIYEGIVAEATYKRSTRKFYFTSPYDQETEALQNPIID